jgi:serine protease inhibitor
MELGLALLERLEGDVVLSPYGLARALDVIRNGASGETRKALDAVLGDAPPPDVDGIISAQAAWLGKDYAPGPALAGFDTGPLDVKRINAWSDEKTHGMIPRILEHISEDEILAVTDAEYLDAKWASPFEDSRPAPFEGAGEVTMMSVAGSFEHGDGAIRLPYAAGDLRFVAMLGEWHAVEWRRGAGTVELPRFTTTSSLDLAEPLTALGLGPAFELGYDLEALVTGPGVKALSRILQRARVDVDEAGTRAAATTVVMARAVSAPMNPFHIVFDRPFTWAVEHAPTGTLLFVGRVRNPTERSD